MINTVSLQCKENSIAHRYFHMQSLRKVMSSDNHCGNMFKEIPKYCCIGVMINSLIFAIQSAMEKKKEFQIEVYHKQSLLKIMS